MCRYHLFIVSIIRKGELIIISFCFEHQNAVTQINKLYHSKAWFERFHVGTVFFSKHFVLCQILTFYISFFNVSSIMPLC